MPDYEWLIENTKCKGKKSNGSTCGKLGCYEDHNPYAKERERELAGYRAPKQSGGLLEILLKLFK